MFINEFDRIFREIDVDDDQGIGAEAAEPTSRIRERSGSSAGHARRRSRNSMLFMQSGADKLLEQMGDGDLDGDAEEAIFGPQLIERGQAAFRSHSSNNDANTSASDEDTIRQQNRHKLTIDITSAPSHARHGHSANGNHGQPQKSPSVNSASSPRMLYADNNGPLRSPGAPPISPRHGEGLLRKPSNNP